jgi:diaminopimelate epimerase
MQFIKMNGLGNDYIFVDLAKENIKNPQETAKKLSDRNFFIGADGLVLFKKANETVFLMRIFNSDGSEAKTCGNALRCLAKLVYEQGQTNKTEFKIKTLSGLKDIKLHVENEKVLSITVNMGVPVLSSIVYRLSSIDTVNIGNMHAVVFRDNLSETFDELKEMSVLLDLNAEACKVVDKNTINMRVYERGSGETEACGSGAAAVFFAAFSKGLVGSEANVYFKNGQSLAFNICKKGCVYMTGAASYNFKGEI